MIDSEISTLLHPTPSIGVGGILFNKRRQVLLIKRDQPPAQGFWSIPGGRQEPGESIVQACQREFLEETNLAIVVGNIVAVVERRVEGYHYVIIDFLVYLQNEIATEPIARSDISEARWVDLYEIEHFTLVPGLAEIIRRCYALFDSTLPAGLLDERATGTDFILTVSGNFHER